MFPLHDPLNEILRTELTAYDDLTAALLSRRDILTKEDAEKFLNPSYDSHLHDPFLMTDMQRAAERFAGAIVSGEKSRSGATTTATAFRAASSCTIF